MRTTTRDAQPAEFERWADSLRPGDLRPLDVDCLTRLAPGADAAAVKAARDAGHGWGIIARRLGVSPGEARRLLDRASVPA